MGAGLEPVGGGRRRQRNQNPPPSPPPAPSPKTWPELIFAMKDSAMGIAWNVAKIAAGAIAVFTPSGRGLVGQGAGVALDGFNVLANRTEEMINRKTRYTMMVCLLAVVELLISAFATEWGVRLFWLAITFAAFVGYTVASCRETARWWLGAGALWKGFEKADPEKAAALLKGNPMPFFFSSAQPAAEGGLKLLAGYAQFLARAIAHFAIGTLYVFQPFHEIPQLLAIAPIVIVGFVSLGTGYTNEMKWTLWFKYLWVWFACIVALAAFAWNPWLISAMNGHGIGHKWASVDTAHLITFLVLTVIEWYGVKWAARQAAEHTARLSGKPLIYGGGTPHRGGLAANYAALFLLVGLPIALAIVLGGGLLSAMAKSTDGFTRVNGFGIPAWAEKHNFLPAGMSGYERGADAHVPPSSARTYMESTMADEQWSTSVTKVSLRVNIGAMISPVKVTDGDSIIIIVDPATRSFTVGQTGGGTVELPWSGGFNPEGGIATPRDRRWAEWFGDFPMTNQPVGLLIGRIGTDGERFPVGTYYRGVAHSGSGTSPLVFYPNVPIRPEFMGSLNPSDQEVRLTVMVKRRR